MLLPRLPFSRSFFLFVILLHLACSPGTSQKQNSAVLVTDRNQVWRVSAGGTAERLPFEFQAPGGGGGWMGHGTSQPLASPDQRWIAFTRDNDFWLLKIATGQAAQVTRVGKPHDDRHLAVIVWITAWSLNSRQILYYVGEGIRMHAEDYGVRPAPYGFHVYDLESEVSHTVESHGPYDSWLPDVGFLWTSEHELVRFNPTDAKPGSAIRYRSWFGEGDISNDGRWLLLNHGDKTTSRIWKINLTTGAATPLTPLRSRSYHQWPRFSPSSFHISYVQVRTLVVNDQNFYSCPDRLDYRWIDDRTITAVCQGEIVILDVETGEEKGRHKLE